MILVRESIPHTFAVTTVQIILSFTLTLVPLKMCFCCPHTTQTIQQNHYSKQFDSNIFKVNLKIFPYFGLEILLPTKWLLDIFISTMQRDLYARFGKNG